MQRVGLVGLGNTGRFYLQRLKGAGYRVTVLDVDRQKMAWAREQGADDADSPKNLRSDRTSCCSPCPAAKKWRR